MSELVRFHIPCPHCGSSDAYCIYDDGHGYCFSCHTLDKKVEGGWSRKEQKKMSKALIPRAEMEFTSLKHRCISEETCRKFSYYVTTEYNRTLQVAEYIADDGQVLFQKTRDAEKHFTVRGASCSRFFGQHLFTHGKILVVTEGEIDCLSVSQMNGNRYPVVSLPHGCGSAKKTFIDNLTWLEGFEKVVVMFDMDEQGQKAVKDVEGLLPPHKLFIARLPYKDANECLTRGQGSTIINAIFDAKEYRPDGIINACDVEADFFIEDNIDTTSYTYPWSSRLNDMTCGLRKGEMVLFTAGTGIGKSTAVREIAYKLKVVDGLKIGMVMLEENYKKTIRELLSLKVQKPLSKLWHTVDKDTLKKPYEELFGDGGFVLYDHFGSMEEQNLLSMIRYLIVGESCDFIIFDHISIAISGLEDGGQDERKTIDRLMTKLRSLVEETGAGLIIVSHLKKPTGDASFEEGGVISLDDLRGSGSLKQIPDEIIALERNQQADDEYLKNVLKIRVLKNRFSGDTGLAGQIVFDKKTHRLKEIEDNGGF